MNIFVKYIFVLTLWGGTLLSAQAQKLTVSEVEMASGQTSSFVVGLKEAQPNTYNALSFNMLCPEGVSIVGNPLLTDLWINPFCVTNNDVALPVASVMEQYESVMFYAVGDLDQNSIVKMAFASASEIPVTETDSLLTLTIGTAANLSPDNYFIKIQNILFESDPMGKDKANDATARLRVFKLGDADRNDAVNVADATDVINYILGERSENYNIMLADMNDDKEIDIFDVMKLKHVILNGKLPNQSQALSRTAEYGIYEDMMLAFSNAGVTIGIPNSQRFTSFQFEIELTDDIELTGAQLIGMSTNHSIEFAKIDDNYYRVLGLSMDNSLLEGNSGNNLIGLEIPNCGKISIHNAMFVTPQGEVTYFNDNEIENGITGIRPVMAPDSESVYDLLGRKITTKGGRLPKGVYIINNKRVVVK